MASPPIIQVNSPRDHEEQQRGQEQQQQGQQNQHQQQQDQQQFNDGQQQQQGDLGRINVRIPAFWPDHPELWFIQLEAQFALQRITSETTRYRWVIANLEPRYATEILDLITTPPENNPYSTIRLALITRLTESRQARLHQLLAGQELGDRRPSQMLRHLRSIDASVPENIVRTVWLDHLPEAVRAVVTTQMEMPADQLGQIADSVFDVVGNVRIAAMSNQRTDLQNNNRPGIIQAAPITDNQSFLPQVSAIEGHVAELARQVTAFITHDRRSNRSQNRPQAVQQNNNDVNNGRLCWFHFRFRERARKCIEPCSWTGADARQNQGNSRQNR